jgi:pyridoxamine 5'-phosphate oxidase
MQIHEVARPHELFRAWFDEALRSKMEEPTAAALATVDEHGMPQVRMVLIKQATEEGFVFYTNRNSRKGLELAANNRAALCFHWINIGKQVRINGRVQPVSDEQADAYFATRPRESQIGAWASEQSSPMKGKYDLVKAVVRYMAKFALARAVPRPPFWVGYRLVPERFEFWLKKPFRLHERLLYERSGDGWTRTWLFP